MKALDQQLVVEFLGEEYLVEPESRLTFGRSADLTVDDNRHLHRVLGVFERSAGLWWLHNVGSALTIDLVDKASPSRLTVTPGSAMAVVFEEATVRFQAGSTSYELGVEVPIPAPEVHAGTGANGVVEPEVSRTNTVTAGDLAFTPDQLRCVVVLCERRLVDPSSVDLPTNRLAAQRLGWKLTRFNRKLDNVCAKLARAGISGLHGDMATLATKRRERLVDYAVASGLVTPGDLELIPDPEAK